ncbi:hypothetical protein DCAR_0103092 [Daucus carota subsp. sativus]|uniref:Uncharacterized protein n=1 Tax=Daucus carota subsp. sativus TaxID=79200 RepID=A0AAF0W6C0_DAUCS|nr:hypothetical protein DCAR_0103092 [Daucus carota subsp. sativus]
MRGSSKARTVAILLIMYTYTVGLVFQCDGASEQREAAGQKCIKDCGFRVVKCGIACNKYGEYNIYSCVVECGRSNMICLASCVRLPPPPPPPLMFLNS